jgi:ParB-like chromosome segregation protein Spo0J
MIKTRPEAEAVVPKLERTPPVGVRWHEYADIFPWMEGQAFRELVEDVRKNGVMEPIVFMGEFILDGRNRYMAAREIGCEYPRVEYEGDDPLGFVISKNARRRDLTPSQRAAIALTLEKELAKAAKVRQAANLKSNIAPKVARLPQQVEPLKSAGSKSRETAASAVGASPRYVQDAKAIEKASPALLAEVVAGSKTIPQAKREITPLKVREREISFVDPDPIDFLAELMFDWEHASVAQRAQFLVNIGEGKA